MRAGLSLNASAALSRPSAAAFRGPDKVTQAAAVYARILRSEAPHAPHGAASRRSRDAASETVSRGAARRAQGSLSTSTGGRLTTPARQPAPSQGADEWEQF